MIEAYWAALAALAFVLLMAAIDFLIQWDKASTGLVAGTHEPPAPAFATGGWLIVDGSIDAHKISAERLDTSRISAQVATAAVAMGRLGQAIHEVTPLTMQLSQLLSEVDADWLREYYSADRRHFTTTIDPVGPGRFKLTHTEGTIHD